MRKSLGENCGYEINKTNDGKLQKSKHIEFFDQLTISAVKLSIYKSINGVSLFSPVDNKKRIGTNINIFDK